MEIYVDDDEWKDEVIVFAFHSHLFRNSSKGRVQCIPSRSSSFRGQNQRANKLIETNGKKDRNEMIRARQREKKRIGATARATEQRDQNPKKTTMFTQHRTYDVESDTSCLLWKACDLNRGTNRIFCDNQHLRTYSINVLVDDVDLRPLVFTLVRAMRFFYI